MKFTSSILLAFASTIIAAPTPIAPTLSPRQDAINNAINQWLTDINTVNNFLNTVFSSDDPTGFAAIVLQTAQNEPVQLGILTNLLTDNDSAGQANSANLMSKFGGVPTALQNIINGGDVTQNVAAINELRCGDVLPNIGALWQNVCRDNLVPVVAFPPGPFVCPFDGSTNSYQIV